MTSYLVMLQTNSNQSFIFSSPRLREQIGASFDITLLSHWVKKEAKEILDTDDLPTSFWVSDSSGKVIVRFAGHGDEPKAKARDLIRRVTLRALTDAPGLDVTGVFVKASCSTVDADDLQELDHVFLEYSLNRRPAAARFPQLPFLQRAEESALPASTPLTDEDEGSIREYAKDLGVPLLADKEKQLPTQTVKDKGRSLSLPSRAKRAWSRSARHLQLQDVVKRQRTSEDPKGTIANLYEDPFQLEKAFQDTSDESDAANAVPELSSVGVIHIDGNGVGAIMRDLGEAFKGACCHLDSLEEPAYNHKDNPCNIDEGRFQWFVMEVNYRLDGVVKQAVAKAWEKVTVIAREDKLPGPPVVPVLVGGDDVTVYTDGRYAIPFAEAYIHYYEELTKNDDLLSVLAIVAGGKKPDAPERDHFEIGDYIIQKPGPLTASAGVAIVGRNFPFHIAYDLAEELVKRGKKLGKKKREVPCSTIDFHVLRDATVLDPEDTLNEYKGRMQRPFLVGHYAPERNGEAARAAASGGAPQSQDQWKRVLQAVAVFDGKQPDDPTQTTGDPFPRARANRIVKLLAEGKAEKAATEWDDALQNAPRAGLLVKQLKLLLLRSSSSDEAGESLEQIKWLLDLIDLSENLPDGYIACRIARDANGQIACDEASGATTAGGTK
ncbi:hypothetical protein QP415_08500 [Pauljensenia sp. UMB3104]|uniref:hypothetical protein n=1 Tax=Pauljensenia sp. UMB3104 TaxID=3046331 RepID=UPI00254FB08B|nr:hypothetical protein [Pauljensenia sp. UMB3104]MBS6967798.1 hypothetical protein [Actinomyces sp.]MDK7159894.1 hypothetical protein [Pauljensenia sp. UMB3104]